MVVPTPVQLVPFVEYAIVFPASPTATHKSGLVLMLPVTKLPETFNPPVNVVAPSTWSVPLIVVLESVDVPVTFNPPDNVVDDVTLRVPTTVLPLLAISPTNVL